MKRPVDNPRHERTDDVVEQDILKWMESFDRVVVFRVKRANQHGKPPTVGSPWRCHCFMAGEAGRPETYGLGDTPEEAFENARTRITKCPTCGHRITAADR